MPPPTMPSACLVSKPQLPAELEPLEATAISPGVEFEAGLIADVDWSQGLAARMELEAVKLERVDMTSAKLRESSWMDVHISGGQFGGTDLAGLTARRIAIETSRMSGCIMSESTLRDVRISSSKLNMTNFRFAKLKNVIFKDCDFTEADFAGATLAGVMFQNCKLERTNFDGAAMSVVDITSCELIDLVGVRGLAGATIGYDQLATIAPNLANELGILLKKD